MDKKILWISKKPSAYMGMGVAGLDLTDASWVGGLAGSAAGGSWKEVSLVVTLERICREKISGSATSRRKAVFGFIFIILLDIGGKGREMGYRYYKIINLAIPRNYI